MKKLFLLLGIVIASYLTVNAQTEVFLSQKSEFYEFNEVTKQYDLVNQVPVDVFFAYEEDRFIIEIDGKARRVWWVFKEYTPSGSMCYATEGDLMKICLNLDEGRVTIFSDGEGKDQFSKAWNLVDITKVAVNQ
jgi:hypothetical protein